MAICYWWPKYNYIYILNEIRCWVSTIHISKICNIKSAVFWTCLRWNVRKIKHDGTNCHFWKIDNRNIFCDLTKGCNTNALRKSTISRLPKGSRFPRFLSCILRAVNYLCHISNIQILVSQSDICMPSKIFHIQVKKDYVIIGNISTSVILGKRIFMQWIKATNIPLISNFAFLSKLFDKKNTYSL